MVRAMSSTLDERTGREREHWSRFDGDPEVLFGWSTPAGRLRARRRADLVAQGARLGPGVRALEVGCGTGLFTELWAATGASLVAVDLSPDLLARARARGLPATVKLLERRFEDCDVEGPFDAVIGSSVLHHLALDQALARMRDLLKPGGRIAFAEPNMLNPQIALTKNIPFLKRLAGDSPDETAFVAPWLARDLRRAGFGDIAIAPFDWLHPSTPTALIGLVQRAGGLAERLPVVRAFAGSLIISATRG